jgi:DNA-3-methyladenine glycosylase II
VDDLLKIKGVGKWTAEMFLMFSLNRPDVFSHGDVGLQRAMKNIYGLTEYNFETFENISKKWSPYRTYACDILWQSLDNSPMK